MSIGSIVKYRLGKEVKYKILKIDKNAAGLDTFDCGNEIINEYVHHLNADSEDGVSYLIQDEHTNVIIGMFTIQCSAIRLEYIDSNGVSYKVSEPAIEIKYFAISTMYQKLLYDDDYSEDSHFYFSDMIFTEIIQLCREITNNVIGASKVILYAVPDAVHFYERNLLDSFSQYQYAIPDSYRYIDGCSPMYMSL